MNVVFLHGVVGSSATYSWLPDRITAGRTVLRPDFRGHGAAPRTPGAYRLPDYGADVIELLRGLDGPAVIVGHSLGGVTAWWVAQQAPELVSGIFLEDPPLYLGSREGHAGNTALATFRLLREMTVSWQEKGVTREGAALRIAAAAYDEDRSQGEVLTEEAIAARAYSLLHVDPEVFESLLDGSLLEAADVDAPVSVPVTVLAAGVAPAFSRGHADRLKASHPHVRILRAEGAGHSIHDERAHRETYVDRVVEFLVS